MTYRTMFEETIGPEPAAKHTVDELIAGYRRRTLARRLAGGGAGAAAAVLLVVGASALASPGPSPSPGRPSGAAVAPSGSGPGTAGARPTRTPLGVEPTETTEHARQRLAAAIDAAVRGAIPGVRLDGPFVVEHKEQPLVLDRAGSIAGSSFYETEQTVRTAKGHGTLSVSLMRRYADTTCTPTATPPSPGDPTGYGPHVSCRWESGPQGAPVVTTVITGEAPDLVRAIVAVDNRDGSTVIVGLEFEGSSEPVDRTQLQSIATDYRVTLYP
jgi:hypothetical protein